MSKSFKRNQDGELKREQYFRSERRNSRLKRSPDVDERINQGYSENNRKAWNFLADEESNCSTLKG